MEKTILGLGIYEYKLSDADLSQVNQAIEEIVTSLQWRESLTMGRTSNYRVSDSIDITLTSKTAPEYVPHDQLLYRLFNEAVQSYTSEFSIKIKDDEGYELLRYKLGGHYKQHVDSGGSRADRVVSGLLYVNDNYKGGELEFVRLGLKIKPRAGTILLFPSNYVYEHIAHPVEEGTKFAVVTFFNSTDTCPQPQKVVKNVYNYATNL